MPASSATCLDPGDDPVAVLVVDDDELTIEYVRACLEHGMPGVRVTGYNSGRHGRPGPDFDWSAHDVLLLDYNLGGGETGVDWLRAFAGLPGFPQTILVSGERRARIVGDAVRTGAQGYLNKAELDPDLLVETIRQVLGQPVARRAPAPDPAPAQDRPRFRGNDELATGADGASYRFIRVIGRGAMSRVYLAERVEDGATLVLKILNRDVARDPENVQRFAREGELIARIDSPYVVRIFDHGTTNSYGYIAMEFFGRGDLAQRIAPGVRAGDAVLYLQNIACGLRAIHAEGIVHRDLKPANVMFRGDDSMALVDFGLSKRPDADMSLTQSGVILGTPYCMAPEQTAGHEADFRSDLYSTGVMFYEMLTGRRPFEGRNLGSLLMAIQTKPVPALPREVARYQGIMDRLLAKSPDDRYQDASELIAASAELLAAP